MFSIDLCVRFQADPKESHLKAMKRNLRYLKGTPDLCLWYPKGSNFDFYGYANADYVGFLVDRNRTSSMEQFLASCLVSWATKKQNSVALSTTEAEYISAASCCSQLLWIKQQLRDFNVDAGCMHIYCDNTSAISITKNDVHHKRTKHIDVKHHFLRDFYEKGEMSMEFVATNKQVADIFTKALPRDQYEKNRLPLVLIKITEP